MTKCGSGTYWIARKLYSPMYLEHTQHTCLSFVMQKLNFVTDLLGRILSLELFIGTGISKKYLSSPGYV